MTAEEVAAYQATGQPMFMRMTKALRFESVTRLALVRWRRGGPVTEAVMGWRIASSE
jgi:hypothetical protein